MSGGRAGRKSAQLVVLVVVMVVALPVGLVSVAMSMFDAAPHPLHTPRPFDRVAWLAFEQDATCGTSTRLPMSHALAASGTLTGRTRSDVEALLGAPDERHRRAAGTTVLWELGTDPSLVGSETPCLVIEFDRDDRVSGVYAPGE